jgi:rhomboid family GlyGly-CTERM serine protease
MGLINRFQDYGKRLSGGSAVVPITLLIVAGTLLFAGETGRQALRFAPGAISAGDYWRLLSGHVVHLGWSHFALNAAGLGLVWYLVGGAFDRVNWTIICIVSIIFIDAGLWLFNPRLQWYVGLSGVLHGMLAAGLLAGLRRPQIEIVVLSVLLLAKLAWEQLNGPLPGSESSSGGAVIVDAHLYGAIGGFLAALVILIRVRRTASI